MFKVKKSRKSFCNKVLSKLCVKMGRLARLYCVMKPSRIRIITYIIYVFKLNAWYTKQFKSDPFLAIKKGQSRKLFEQQVLSKINGAKKISGSGLYKTVPPKSCNIKS